MTYTKTDLAIITLSLLAYAVAIVGACIYAATTPLNP